MPRFNVRRADDSLKLAKPESSSSRSARGVCEKRGYQGSAPARYSSAVAPRATESEATDDGESDGPQVAFSPATDKEVGKSGTRNFIVLIWLKRFVENMKAILCTVKVFKQQFGWG